MSRFRTVVVVSVAVVLLAGCEQFFTNNWFSDYQRDPADLPFDQQVAYAESALNSGDPDAMADAYDALADSLEDRNNKDPDLNSLAAELAIGASGLTDTLPDLADAAVNGNFSSQADLANAVNDVLGDVDYAYIDEAAGQLDQITANGGEVSEEQYVFVAAGLMMKEAEKQGGVDNLTAGDVTEELQFVNDAIADLDSRGESSPLLEDLKSMYEGL
jgi:hypothetical protein